MTTAKLKKKQRRKVRLKHPSYQPSKAELEADVRVDATFDELAKASVQPVEIEYESEPKQKPRG